MKLNYKPLIASFLIISNVLWFVMPAWAEPPNLDQLKKEVQAYHDSGLYEKEVAQVISQAKCHIAEQALLNQQSNNPRKLALVLDIDETSLTNYDHMVQRGFSSDPKKIHQAILSANLPAIAPTLSLYRKAKKYNIAVFFVTGRPLSELDATKTNLIRAGFSKWDGLYLRPETYKHNSIVPFKLKTREAISHQGYTIVASIGDQLSDLQGGHALKGFKLPNPFYYLP